MEISNKSVFLSKFVLPCLIYFLISVQSFSQWTTSGSHIYNSNAGNVGIGVTNPSTTLDLSASTAIIRATSSTGTNRAIGIFSNNGGNYYCGAENSVGNGIFGAGGLPYAFGINVSSVKPLQFGTSDSVRMIITEFGKIGIGTTTPTEKLSVNGNISAKKMIVSQTGWSDYVFDKKYKLRSLSSLENFIKQNKHLPEVPTAKEVEEKGVSVGDNQALLLKKIEELTLYLIEQDKKINRVIDENEKLKKIIKKGK